jgi:hypothetical protein
VVTKSRGTHELRSVVSQPGSEVLGQGGGQACIVKSVMLECTQPGAACEHARASGQPGKFLGREKNRAA